MTRRTETIILIVLACAVTVALSFLLPDGRAAGGPTGVIDNSESGRRGDVLSPTAHVQGRWGPTR